MNYPFLLINRSHERIDTVQEIMSEDGEGDDVSQHINLSNEKVYMTSANAHEAVMASIGSFKKKDVDVSKPVERRRTRGINSSLETVPGHALPSRDLKKHYKNNSQVIEIVDGKLQIIISLFRSGCSIIN
jgi:hypothetical protein